jgi:alpha-tubulin suppressor-like RCC1 family protein
MQRQDLLSKSNLLNTYLEQIPRDIVDLLSNYLYHRVRFTDNDESRKLGDLSALVVNDLICGPNYTVLVIDNKIYLAGYTSRLGLFDTHGFVLLNKLFKRKYQDNTLNNKLLSSMQIQKIGCGYEHMAILTTDGRLYTVGNNIYGILGINKYDSDGLNFIRDNVSDVSVGGSHTMFISDGILYSFGKNVFGECGVGHSNPVYEPMEVISGSPNVTAIFCGYPHSAFIKGDKLYMCGENSYGLITNRTISYWVGTPEQIDVPGMPEKICYGYHHCCMIINKQLYIRGYNDNGQLGLPKDKMVNRSLIHVKEFENEIVEDIACGGNYSIVKVSGIIYGTGNNYHNQLGLPEMKNYYAWTPLPINNLNIDVHKISASNLYVGYLI